MTEITGKKKLPAAGERFILHWGDMGDEWGVNRSVSQIHGLLYLAEAPTLLELMRRTPPFVRLLLAVGHNPGFHELALMLTGAGDRLTRARLEHGMPTAAFAVIDFDAADWSQVKPGSGSLDRFVTPEDLPD